MTTPDAAVPFDLDGLPDFTVSRATHLFRIGADVFKVPAVVSSKTLLRLAELAGVLTNINMTDEDSAKRAIEGLGRAFELLMPGAPGRLFRARLESDGDPGDMMADPPVPPSPEPIDLMREAIPALFWILEKYGLRPMVPSSPSPDGSTDGQTSAPSDGTSSTVGASDTGLITVASPLVTS